MIVGSRTSELQCCPCNLGVVKNRSSWGEWNHSQTQHGYWEFFCVPPCIGMELWALSAKVHCSHVGIQFQASSIDTLVSTQIFFKYPNDHKLQWWPYTARMALYCKDGSVLQGWPFFARMALHCKDGSVLQEGPCTTRIALHCKDGPALQGWLCTARIALHCKNGPVLQGWPCTARMALHCKDGSVLQG